MLRSFQEDGRSVGAHPGVDDGDENAAVREVGASIGQGYRAVAHVLRGDAVGQVDDGRIRINRKNDPAHHAHVGIGEAKVGGENYRRIRHSDPYRLDA